MLTDCISHIDNIYDKFNKINTDYDMYNQTYISELSDIINSLMFAYAKANNIYNICNNTFNNTFKKYKKGKIKNNNVIINNLLTTSKKLTDNIEINVKVIKSLDELPDMHLYWVSDINQFAFRLNNIVFRGNVGNIINTKISDIVESKYTVMCKNKNNCKLLKTQTCIHYHDPVELLKLLNDNKIDNAVYNKYKYIYRNFRKPYTHQNFGSREKLKNDIDILNFDNNENMINFVDNYKQICMHDILVILSIDAR